jgi:hypothetical protein
MRRRILNASVVLSLSLCASCASKVSLPIKTSLGDLTRIEKKDKVNTNKEGISPKSGEVIYVLSFEGKKEHEVKAVAVPELITMTGGLSDNSDIRFDNFNVSASPGMASALNLPLVDSSGKEFAPVFFGTPNTEGVISNNGARFNGHVTGRDGKPWVTTGKFDFPEAKVTVVYVVPESATLSLKDGEQKHSIN